MRHLVEHLVGNGKGVGDCRVNIVSNEICSVKRTSVEAELDKPSMFTHSCKHLVSQVWLLPSREKGLQLCKLVHIFLRKGICKLLL